VDLRLCFFGDSFTAGVGDPEALGWVGRTVARSQSADRAVTGYNLGVRRETTLDVASRLVREAEPRFRDAVAYGVIFATGVNDTAIEHGAQRVEPKQSVAALSEVVDECAARGWPLLVVGPAPIADPVRNERIVALSLAMAALCQSRAAHFASVAPTLVEDTNWLAEVAAGDGAHPGANGYRRLGDLLWPSIESWLPAAAEGDR
jgi:lysophospholipase L1-like esterase